MGTLHALALRYHFTSITSKLSNMLRTIGIGGRSLVLPSHTTGHAGPHPAVRRIKLGVHSRAAWCVAKNDSVPPRVPLGVSLLLAVGRPNKIGFSAAGHS